jgi:hypothetical protein
MLVRTRGQKAGMLGYFPLHGAGYPGFSFTEI